MPWGTDISAHLWSLPDATHEQRLAGPGLWALTITPDGEFLLGAGDDDTVRVWELPSGRPMGALPCPGPRCLAVAPDGEFFMAGCSDGVRVWSLPDLSLRRTLAVSGPAVQDLAMRPDGRLLAGAVGALRLNSQGYVQLWHLPDFGLGPTISTNRWHMPDRLRAGGSARRELARRRTSAPMAHGHGEAFLRTGAHYLRFRVAALSGPGWHPARRSGSLVPHHPRVESVRERAGRCRGGILGAVLPGGGPRCVVLRHRRLLRLCAVAVPAVGEPGP
ncbi:WD40 repeat domain-containing protein [Streptomyces venezuelae]|uniref:WD40 repeat domain-containing protein n=1 Tax=Streptomyces venezuelae TaxID=54571 RepID=UPI00365E0766